MAHFHNNALIGSSGQGGAYEIERSLRFSRDDSAYLNRTPSSAGNRRTFTFSAWVKRSYISTASDPCAIFSAGGSSPWGQISFTTDGSKNHLDVSFTAGVSNGTRTSAQFRDVSAWYHIVAAVDTTQATASDRIKMYVNGVQFTDLDNTNYPAQNFETQFNSTSVHRIGANGASSADQFLGGYLADVHFIDGQALAASDFGEYDDDNNWNPKEFSGTYGTNGFHLDFSDNSTAAALGTDSSGNSNTWTVNNLVAAGGVALPGARTAVFFDGTDDKITYSSNTDLYPGATFTLEAWVYRLDSQEIPVYYGTAVGHVGFRVLSNGGMGVERINTAFDLNYNGSGTSVQNDEWTHVAWTKTGGTLRAFINGSNVATATNNSFSYQGDFVTARTLNDNRKFAISDLHLVVGTALYTSNFTPPSTISAHANTKLLCFQNASSATTATTAPSGVTLTATSSPVPGAYPSSENYQIDSLIDSPTNYEADSGNNGGNYATLNPLAPSGLTISDGNLNGSGSVIQGHTPSTIFASSGKFYCEFTLTTYQNDTGVGVAASIANPAEDWIGEQAYMIGYLADGRIFQNSSSSSYSSYAAGDTVGAAFDADTGKVWFHKNGTYQNSGNPAAGTGQVGTITGGYALGFTFRSVGGAGSFNFGQRPFAYTPPTGFVSLCTQNLTDPTIADGSTAMDVVTYSGTGSTQSITTGFSPDLVWLKCRNAAKTHRLYDAVRGATKVLQPDLTDAEGTDSAGLTSFNSDGFTLGGSGGHNGSSDTMVSWAWDGGTSTVSNTDGNVTANVRANASAGFSIISVPSIDSTNTIRTAGHGLNATPYFIISKNRDFSDHWFCYHKDVQTNNRQQLRLNTTEATITSASDLWAHTSSVIGFNGALYVASGNTDNLIFYCFGPVEGYSSFGKYTGDGNADGPFVHTGFRPRWLLIKLSSGTSDWRLFDTARDSFNTADTLLFPSSAEVEATDPTYNCDILSNGFKMRNTHAGLNANNATYIYAAFAEHPFKTARAR